MKIITVAGARPQFIKVAAVSRALFGRCREILVHTGQHYDYGMSEIFFEQLDIPRPLYSLAIGSGRHGKQTGQMLESVEEVLLREKPDLVMVYGDTNSTLAGALAASKLHIPVAHIEAGLRSYNRLMPEETNRILTDHISDLLFCPTHISERNLAKEGILSGVHVVGDVMYDALLYSLSRLDVLSLPEICPKEKDAYFLATVHRAENTDDPVRLASIFEALNRTEIPVVLPLHPRTRNALVRFGLERYLKGLIVTEPLGYNEMLCLQKNARAIITDSGGIQKEAYFLRIPCITLREETEWTETVDSGANVLTGPDKNAIWKALERLDEMQSDFPPVYGDGKAAEKIAGCIMSL